MANDSTGKVWTKAVIPMVPDRVMYTGGWGERGECGQKIVDGDGSVTGELHPGLGEGKKEGAEITFSGNWGSGKTRSVSEPPDQMRGVGMQGGLSK